MAGKVLRALFYDPGILFWFLALFVGLLCFCIYVYEAYLWVSIVSAVLLGASIVVGCVSYFEAVIYNAVLARRICAAILAILAVVLIFSPVYGLKYDKGRNAYGDYCIDDMFIYFGVVQDGNKPATVINGMGDFLDVTKLHFAKFMHQRILWSKFDTRYLKANFYKDEGLRSVFGRTGMLQVSVHARFNFENLLLLINSGNGISVAHGAFDSKLQKVCADFAKSVNETSSNQIDLESLKRSIFKIDDEFYIVDSVKVSISLGKGEVEVE